MIQNFHLLLLDLLVLVVADVDKISIYVLGHHNRNKVCLLDVIVSLLHTRPSTTCWVNFYRSGFGFVCKGPDCATNDSSELEEAIDILLRYGRIFKPSHNKP